MFITGRRRWLISVPVGGGGTGVTGTLAVTDGADETAYSGFITLSGTLSAIEGADLCAMVGSSGGASVSGAFTAVDGADGAIFEGIVLVQGTLSATDGSDGSSATGAILTTGTLSVTEGSDGLTASGTILITGTLSSTDGADTFASTSLSLEQRVAQLEAQMAALDPITFANAVWAQVLSNSVSAENNLVQAAKLIIDANIVQVHGQTINGTGSESDPWGPV